jgi:hypothetical protein
MMCFFIFLYNKLILHQQNTLSNYPKYIWLI